MPKTMAAQAKKDGSLKKKRRIPEGKILKTLYLDKPVVDFLKKVGVGEKRTFTGQVSHILEKWAEKNGLKTT